MILLTIIYQVILPKAAHLKQQYTKFDNFKFKHWVFDIGFS